MALKPPLKLPRSADKIASSLSNIRKTRKELRQPSGYKFAIGDSIAFMDTGILIKDITPQETDDIAVLSHLSYRPLKTESNMMLALPTEWKTCEHYLNGLASKYRSSVRQQILKPIDAAAAA